MAFGAKEFFGTEGVVGLLTWFESIESVLHITKCPTESQVEFASSMLIWNHKMVGSDIDGYTTRFHELAKLVPHMVTPENQRVNRYIQGLAPEIKPHVTSSKPTSIQSAVSMANRLTTDGTKDGIFKKHDNAGNKKRLNDQNKNQGRNDRNKRQRTRRNFALTAPEQGHGKRQYAGPHPKCAKCNFHHSGNCPVCGRCNQVGHFTRNYTGRATNDRPRPTCFELRNVNHTQTLDLADIYGRFVYEENLIQRRYYNTKKALMTTSSSIAISIAFFSNNVAQDFQENYDDEDEEEVLDDEEVTQVKVLMALADDELIIGKNLARNGEWIDITMRKLNHALQEQLKEEKKINEKWLTSSKKVSQCISEQIHHQKKKVLGYDHEMVPKSKDWVERLNLDSKVPNFNTGRILGASPSSEVESLTFQPHSPKERPGLGIMKHTKLETQDSINKSVSGTITISETESTTPSVL
ncbi:hypothetical protein Tco_1264519 [Tanacetum coccineum]